jgi:GT2 family glycosyltransferase/glycosyltransferase involved in cell wall biosynthesis
VWRVARAVGRTFPLGVTTRSRLLQRFYAVHGRLFPGSHLYEEHLRLRGLGRWRPAADSGSTAPESQAAGPVPYDVFVFPVIDWHFRHQRPQQLAAQLARRGHRVFYFATTFVPSDRYQPQLEMIGERIALLRLPCSGTPPIIYEATLSEDQIQSVLAGIEQLRLQQRVSATVSIIDHPFWWSVVERLSNNRTVYDCMDDHSGFSNTAAAMLELEDSIIMSADLVVTTSEHLAARVAPRARKSAVIRNGTDYDHFATPPTGVQRGNHRPVVGYYGAIADWFDADLVATAARTLAHCDFVLIGSTYGADLRALDGVPNVRMTGEVPYAELPAHAHAFDVCIIPFRINALTLNTNPVKVYEYLSMGKPVVSVRLPELELLSEHVRLADTAEGFCEQIRLALSERSTEDAERRRAFARCHTWAHRAESFSQAVTALFPPISVIVLTHNGLAFTKACLQSLERHSDYPDWELVIVDNASSDGTPQFLQAYAASHKHVRLVLNRDNVGFAAGNNAGARVARGQYLVFLNNDTYVTAGWLGDMVRHFECRRDLALLNPVTNNIGNEARVDIAYANMEEMVRESRRITNAGRAQSLDLEVCAFFCVMIPRRVWDEVGELDEQFGTGFFEDDDYARRAKAKGYCLACAEDVFVHHHLSASFDALGHERKRELFDRNLRLFEAKWGTWVPHVYRDRRAGQ